MNNTMHTIKCLTFLALALGFAYAAPIPIETTTGYTAGAPGNPGAVYFCNGVDWTGNCKYINHNLLDGGCPGVDPDFAHAKSIGGDNGPTCTVYSEANCGGASLDVTFPGTSDADGIHGWPGTVASFACEFAFDPPK